MTTLAGHGLAVRTPAGWDAHIYRRPRPERGTTHPVLHVANFALPPDRGDFGAGAVERMGSDHVLVTLVEYAPASAATPLFARVGMPRPLSVSAFRPDTLQRAVGGQGGSQWFFRASGRPFCLYVVLGSLGRRRQLVPEVNRVLDGIVVEPAAPGGGP